MQAPVSVLAGVDEPVDRLSTGLHRPGVGEVQAGTAGDHLRCPPITQLAGQVGDRRVTAQTCGLMRPCCPVGGFAVGPGCPVLDLGALTAV